MQPHFRVINGVLISPDTLAQAIQGIIGKKTEELRPGFFILESVTRNSSNLISIYVYANCKHHFPTKEILVGFLGEG